jgi:hypothetical protein
MGNGKKQVKEMAIGKKARVKTADRKKGSGINGIKMNGKRENGRKEKRQNGMKADRRVIQTSPAIFGLQRRLIQINCAPYLICRDIFSF